MVKVRESTDSLGSGNRLFELFALKPTGESCYFRVNAHLIGYPLGVPVWSRNHNYFGEYWDWKERYMSCLW